MSGCSPRETIIVDLTPPKGVEARSAIIATEQSTGGDYRVEALTAVSLVDTDGTIGIGEHQISITGDASKARTTILFYEQTLARLGGLTPGASLLGAKSAPQLLRDIPSLGAYSAEFEAGTLTPLEKVDPIQDPLYSQRVPWSNSGCAEITAVSSPIANKFGGVDSILPIVVQGERRAIAASSETRYPWLFLVSHDGTMEDITPSGLYPVAEKGPGPSGGWGADETTVWYGSLQGLLMELDVSDPRNVRVLSRNEAPANGYETSRLNWLSGVSGPGRDVEIFVREREGRLLRFVRTGTIARWDTLETGEYHEPASLDERGGVAVHGNIVVSSTAYDRFILVHDRSTGETSRVAPNDSGSPGIEWVEGIGFVLSDWRGQFSASQNGFEWTTLPFNPKRAGSNGPDWIMPIEGGFLFGAPVGIVGQFADGELCPLPCGDDHQGSCNVANISIRDALRISPEGAAVAEFFVVGTPIAPSVTPGEIVRLRVR